MRRWTPIFGRSSGVASVLPCICGQAPGPCSKETYSTAVNWAWHARADKPSARAHTPRDTAIQLQFTRSTDMLQAIYQLSYNGTTTPPQVQDLGGGQTTTH